MRYLVLVLLHFTHHHSSQLQIYSVMQHCQLPINYIRSLAYSLVGTASASSLSIAYMIPAWTGREALTTTVVDL